ncbi:4-hyroxy-2-oxovalerate/4-hydroxy-2-oxopentanoic acid aldolase, class I [Cupriavidus phytorum]|uniref:4-hydroxy-2-oxovalerate aldolase n=2 Tax=Cupriavidus TaxID=106589 RepID=A0A975XIQ0_9BURK|nr:MULTISPECIES: 4-hydroxy-2-oxovalerate aldolase [Cupriavidus]PZX34283.1 4-hydroxy 2-oxovalerate aldolase [Cupriavidus alkaliphilus]SOY71798.1 4-hyroxy-2-oxovalerate/4-hydroxy-2-oxopentanoic acid aldolase, class I [Cupriavidus taiwanensis]
MAKITFVDVTLRDGNHTYRHQFTPEIVHATAAALDTAGVDIIEVGHGDGLGGSCLHVGRGPSTDRQLLEAACSAVKRAKVGILLLPGFGLFADLEMAAEVGVSVARIATHCTEADVTEQHLRRAKDLGMFTVGYLISAGMASPEQLAEQAQKLESYGADYVNLAESQGHLVPGEVAARIRAVRQAVKIPIGFHPHNNLGLAIGNILAAVDEGATFIDGSLKGFGGGAGNAQTEVAIAALKRAGHEVEADLFGIMDAADIFAQQVAPQPMPVIDNDSLLMGYANVYGGYIHPVRHAAETYRCDPRALVLRLGERKVVAAQEDVVIEEAQKLSCTSTN